MKNLFNHILENASLTGKAVGAVNIFNYVTAEAAIEAANEIGENVIIQTSAGTVRHFGTKRLFNFIDGIRRCVDIEVALHLDHCSDTELGKRCVQAGWDCVMMDFSQLPYDENVKKTKEMVDFAHPQGVAVEGEVGIISGVEEEVCSDVEVRAGYDETVKFIAETGIDAIAPAIGTAHGVYKGVPKIDFELVQRLGNGTTPVVIHGGSGLTAEVFTELVRLGGRKINISTVVKNSYLETVKRLVESGENYSPIKFDDQVKSAVKAEVARHLLVFSTQKNQF